MSSMSIPSLMTLPGADIYQAGEILRKISLVPKYKLADCERDVANSTFSIREDSFKLFEGRGAGGLVNVKINSNNFIVDIKTDLRVDSKETQELFLRLIRTAQENAFDKVQEYQIEQTKRILDGFERVLDSYINEKS